MKKNCTNCKYSFFTICDTLKNNSEFMKIAESDNNILSDELWNFKESFVCENFKSKYIEYPIEVSKMNIREDINSYRKSDIGKLAKVRPCKEEYSNKTYIGIFLGELPIGHSVSHNPDSKELNISFRVNPAIFVPELKKIIYGCESWWSIIDDASKLDDITDDDINNTWYVQALNQLK